VSHSRAALLACLIALFGARLHAAAPAGKDPAAVKEVLSGRRKVANAAWWGFDPGNATAALQAAIRSGAAEVIVPDMGRPWIVDPVFLESDQKLTLRQGVVVEARRGGFLEPNDSLLNVEDKRNVTIEGTGASLLMHKEDYRRPPYQKAEWRHCLVVKGSESVRIRGIRCAGSGGDGIYVGRTAAHPFSKDVSITDVVMEDNYRQGISVISVDGLFIERAILRGTEGTAPSAGIDFEPNHADERLVRIKMSGCDVEKNAGVGILVAAESLTAASAPVDILIEGGRVAGNRGGAVMVVSAAAAGGVTIRSGTLEGRRHLSRAGTLRVQIDTSTGSAAP
jgi:hypothetical protein